MSMWDRACGPYGVLEQQVVAFGDHHPGVFEDRNAAGDGLFDGAVERGRPHVVVVRVPQSL